MDGGEEGVEAVEDRGVKGDSDDGEIGVSGGDAGQVCGGAGGGDDDLEATVFGLSGVAEGAVGGPVCGEDGTFEGDFELFEKVAGGFHPGPVGLAAHDDANDGAGVGGADDLGFGVEIVVHAGVLGGFLMCYQEVARLRRSQIACHASVRGGAWIKIDSQPRSSRWWRAL